MAGVMLATGMGGEAMATSGAAHEPESKGARTELAETVHASPEAERYAEKFGLSAEDAEALDDAIGMMLTGGAVERASGFAKIRFYLSIADNPPSLDALVMSEMLERTPPGTDIDLGRRGHYIHKLDGSIVSVIGGEEELLYNGAGEDEGAEIDSKEDDVIEGAYEIDGEEVEEVEVVEPEKEATKSERKDGDPLTIGDLLDVRENPAEVTRLLLDLRSQYDGDAEFNVALRHIMVHMSLLTGVSELDASFGSYVVDGDGALWVHAPSKDPVRVVGPR